MKKIIALMLAMLMMLACAAVAEGTGFSITTGLPTDTAPTTMVVQLDNEPGARPQKGIGSGVDMMCSGLIIHNAGGDGSFISILIVTERIFILRVSGTKYNDLCIPVNKLRNDCVQQIQTFLIGQSGD